MYERDIFLKLALPDNFLCKHCVFQVNVHLFFFNLIIIQIFSGNTTPQIHLILQWNSFTVALMLK